MKPDVYNRYVADLELLARRDPAQLRKRVRMLIAAGYAYVLGVLLAIVLAAAAIIWIITVVGGVAIKFAIPLLIVAWMIAKSLWVKTAPPAGMPLTRDAAPQLFKRVEEIRTGLAAPRADQVLLSDDFNASVTQIPRLGIFGWPKTYLTLGVPLMFGLEKQQFDAVLSHEFAHLSGAHPKLGLWVYRMSRTWQQLFAHLEATDSWASKIFERFVAWYHPRLRAYGFVMSRRDEYEADADAAAMTSPEAMGGALLAIEVRGRTLEEHFWPAIWQRVKSDPEPPPQTWTAVPSTFRDATTEPKHAEWLGRALTRRALDDDTHPSLSERLTALSLPADVTHRQTLGSRFVGPLKQSAGEFYLGERAPTILGTLEQQWRESVSDMWKFRHEEMRTVANRAAELKAKDTDSGALDAEEMFELACAVSSLEDSNAAIPYLRRVVVHDLDHAGANFMLGRDLLSLGDATGAAYLRRAMRLDVEAVPASLEILRRFHAERGDVGEIERVQHEQHEHFELMRAAAKERNSLTKGDTLVRADLAASDLARFQQIANSVGKVSGLWVARKVTTLLPDRPMIIVVVEPKLWRIGWVMNPQKLAGEVLSAIQLGFTADVLVLALTTSDGWLYRKVRKVDGVHVFRRGDH